MLYGCHTLQNNLLAWRTYYTNMHNGLGTLECLFICIVDYSCHVLSERLKPIFQIEITSSLGLSFFKNKGKILLNFLLSFIGISN